MATRIDRPAQPADKAAGPHVDRPEDVVPGGAPAWGSDVIVDMLKAVGVEYVALNPGASFRGLHDSLVNHGANTRPGIILCNHEEIAVAVAHGYAKATGRAMAAALHTNIGLLHGSMAIFNAFVDRAPVLLLGGTGPMDSTHRRPGVDWHHTSNGIGSVVRDFTKWEQQPTSVAALPEAILRAWQLANVEPAGPVYVALDAGIQETPVPPGFVMPATERYRLPGPVAPDLDLIREAAAWLSEATQPVILLGQVAGDAATWDALIGLAELLGAPVLQDPASMTGFPTSHPLSQASLGPSRRAETNAVIGSADVILDLDHRTVAGLLRQASSGRTNHYANLGEDGGAAELTAARVIHVSLDHHAVRSWAADFQELAPSDLAIAASVGPSVVALTDAVERHLTDHPPLRAAAEARSRSWATRRATLETGWERRREERWDLEPMSMERLVATVRSSLGAQARDAVVARIPNTWVSGLWDFDRPLAHLGKDGGGGLGSTMGMAIGAAIGLADRSRPVVAFLGDGDALFASSALWTAAHHRVPVLFVVANNRSYYNDEEHQAHIARVRGRPERNRWIGMRMDDPAVDFAGVARAMGIQAYGPIASPDALAAAMEAAVADLLDGQPVLVDVTVRAD